MSVKLGIFRFKYPENTVLYEIWVKSNCGGPIGVIKLRTSNTFWVIEGRKSLEMVRLLVSVSTFIPENMLKRCCVSRSELILN